MTQEALKTCNNCAYRSPSWFLFIREHGMDSCLRTGWLCSTQRKSPNSACDVDFSGWVQRPKPFLFRLISEVFGRGK